MSSVLTFQCCINPKKAEGEGLRKAVFWCSRRTVRFRLASVNVQDLTEAIPIQEVVLGRVNAVGQDISQLSTLDDASRLQAQLKLLNGRWASVCQQLNERKRRCVCVCVLDVLQHLTFSLKNTFHHPFLLFPLLPSAGLQRRVRRLQICKRTWAPCWAGWTERKASWPSLCSLQSRSASGTLWAKSRYSS